MMNSLLVVLWGKTRAVRNYVQKRLDLVTRIEIILFFGFLLFYFLHSWNKEFAWTLQTKGQPQVLSKFLLFSRIAIVSLLASGYTIANKQLRSLKNEILLTLPVSRNFFARERLLELLLPFLLFYPVWMIMYLLFARYAGMPVTWDLLLALAHSGWYFFAVLTGMVIFLTVAFPRKLKSMIISGVMLVLTLLSVVYMSRIQGFTFQMLYGITLPALTVAAGFADLRLLTKITEHNPQLLAPKQARIKHKSAGLFLAFYTLLTPRSIKALVIKDCTYIFRNYKSFLLTFLGLLVVLVIGIGKSTVAHDGIQWFLSINIAAAWVLANAAFRFVEQRVESLAIIRALPVKAGTYWWGKFWLAFLPVLWLVIAGMVIFMLVFGYKEIALLESAAAVLFIAFTLIFVQTNFALYSYPYPRYAVLWYNLYLILAVAFFTVLLSPLITIGFLLFGYAAVFLVLKRIKTVEIIND